MKVGVVGLGGLGHMAVKFLKAFGCEVRAPARTSARASFLSPPPTYWRACAITLLQVTIISTSPGKKEEALSRLGADHFLVRCGG